MTRRAAHLASRSHLGDSERFWSKVDMGGPVHPVIGTACFDWTASKVGNGYGLFWFGGKTSRAHRVAWEMKNGPIPDDLQVLHRCDRRMCVRVDHLFVGTNQDNHDDMMAKGRNVNLRGEAHGNAKLKESEVLEIRSSADPHREIASRFGVSRSLVYMIRARQKWAHVQC